jgi:hypothetical protein
MRTTYAIHDMLERKMMDRTGCRVFVDFMAGSGIFANVIISKTHKLESVYAKETPETV